MKKVFLAVGLFAFLLVGIVSIDTATANDNDNVVYDDPPKADKKKSSKSCADYSKHKCCSSKSANVGQKECNDKEATKSAKATTTTNTTATTTTKKSSPDKK